MIALGGFTRFPTFYTGDGRTRLGAQSPSVAFNQYVETLQGKFLAIHTLARVPYRSRWVVEGMAVNAEIKTEEELVKRIYTFPHPTPEPILMNVYAWGITLKGSRRNIFVPLLSRRALAQDEVNALLQIATITDLTVDRTTALLNALGIEIVQSRILAGDRRMLELRDPQVADSYKLLVARNGRVVQVNFCFDLPESLYLSELVMLVRGQRNLHILSGFDY